MFERSQLLWLLMLTPLIAAPGLVAFGRGRRLGGALEALVRALTFGVIVLLLAGLKFPVRVGANHMAVVALVDESRSIAPDQRAWMRERVADLARVMDPADRLAVIDFGRDTRLVAPLGDPRLLGAIDQPLDGGATNLGSALTTALGIFPADAEKRVVLLSDGNQTAGNALAEAPALAQDGVRVFAAAPPPSSLRRVALTALQVPDPVRAYTRFALRLDIESEAREALPGKLVLYRNGKPVGAQTMTLQPGLNRFELPYQIDQPGAYEMSVGLSVPAPAVTINPRASTSLSVLGTPRILLVAITPSKSVVDALKLRHYEVDVMAPSALPERPQAYLDYQAVILADVTSATVSPAAQSALDHYVSDFGGGLIVTGAAMLDGGFKGSELEKALPVRFRPQPPPPTREPIAVYLCIDRSNSMSYNSRDPEVRDGERIRYAKRAAIALLNQLDDTDFVGVIAFDSQPYVLSHLRPLGEDRAQLVQRIERLEPGGGTDFKEALEIAEREIVASGLAVRQVILLTDGDTNREYHDHDNLMAAYAHEGIPVSTIRIGPDLANLRLLKDFASITGGTFYRVGDIEKLPQLLVHLTQRASNRKRHDRAIESGDPSTILSGIAPGQIPAIDYAAEADVKNGAEVPLRLRHGGKTQPLLATWQYGLGRAAVLMADPDALTSLSWVRWNRYAEFWSQLVSWVMRQGSSGPFDLRIADRPDGVRIEAQKADSAPVAGLYCRIAGGPIVLDVAMSQVDSALYRGEAGTLPPGAYTATLMLKANDLEQALERQPFIVAPVAADAAELKLRPPDIDLLRNLAAATGGALSVAPAEVLKRRGATVTDYRSAAPYLLPLAILLLLGSILVRRRLVIG
ncbi:MAG TPA: VWA domain-containing protein [Candidatus Binataceae bacterium]|nr:VWA domain-containing protein [Candidatus Binataceae bacterium]